MSAVRSAVGRVERGPSAGYLRLTWLVFWALGFSAPSVVGFPGEDGSDPAANPPNDPDYPGMWQLISAMPSGHHGSISEAERELGAGIRVDRAWQLHTGAPTTVIAVLDSGIFWEAPDLLEQVHLNAAELPRPSGSIQHDVNGDGRISVADYAADPRLSDANGNGVIDGGDLIKCFGDGVDDDRNGYTDDIAGWDFHENDNDPADRVRFEHGTYEAERAVGALDNGLGGAGVCGHCSFIPIRVDDSFIVDGNAFARAVHYATDMRVDVIQQALGAVSTSPFVQREVDRAYDRNIVVIGTAGDETSYHHNFPSTLDPIVYTNALRYDSRLPEDAGSFVAFNNCSNFGARVDVATSGRSCSSEATANLGGTAGLALSYAQSRGLTLTAGELVGLIKNTASDINLGSNANAPWRYPTWAQWDAITGYGRTDAFAMLSAIKAGKIPPEARIVSPAWFSVYANQSADTSIAVSVRAALPRSGYLRARLDVARGVETSGASWLLVNETPILSGGLSGIFSRVPVAVLTTLAPSERDGPQHRDAYTFRFTVDDLNGGRTEARRTIFVFSEPTLSAGYPLPLGASGESAGLFADLDRDGREELVVATGDGRVHAFAAGGVELPGFPAVTVPSRHGASRDDGAAIVAPLASADLDEDGELEIVALSFEGHVSVLEPSGAMRRGFPVQLPAPSWLDVGPGQILAQGNLAAPTLADLDGDGLLEIVVPGLDGGVHVFRADGKAQAGFPIYLTAGGKRAKLLSSPAASDLDGDRLPDLVLGSNHVGSESGYLFAISGRGSLAPQAVLQGFPTRIPIIRDMILPTIGTGVPTAPVVADIDGDGRREILVHGFVGKAYAVNLDGAIKRSFALEVSPTPGINDTHMLPACGSPIVADLSGDGILDPISVGFGRRLLTSMTLGGRRYPFSHAVTAWDGATGAMRATFPRPLDDMPVMVSPLALDLDGNRTLELVASSGHWIGAWGQSGEAQGFPKFTGGWVLGSPAVGDLDGDGRLEIAATTREGYVFVWHTQARVEDRGQGRGWFALKGDNARTGAR